MIPKRLLLKNFIGIKKGLGLDTFEFDFTELKPGVVGIVGETGSGKTIIAENMNPYLKLITRPGGLQKHCYGKSALKEFEFEMGGNEYLSRVMINPASNSLRAFLYKKIDGDWVVLTDKKKEYEKAITEIVGEFDSFCKSVFTPQGDQPIITLKDADRKSLFINLFRLNKYPEKYLPIVKAEKEKLKEDIDNAKIFIRSHKEKKELKEQLVRERDIVNSDLIVAKLDLSNLKEEEGVLKNSLKRKEDDLQRTYKERDDLRKIESEINKVRNELNAKTEQIKDKIRSIEIKIQAAEQEKERASTWLLQEPRKLSRYLKIVDNKEKIIEKKNRFDFVNNELHRLEAIITQHKNSLKHLSSLKKSAGLIKNRIDEYESLNKEHSKRASLLSDVPCKNMDISKTCKLLSDANESASKLGFIKEKISALEIEYKEALSELEKQKDLYDIEDVKKQYDALLREKQILNDEKWESLASQIDYAIGLVSEYEANKTVYQELVEGSILTLSELNSKLENSKKKYETLSSPYLERISFLEKDLKEKENLLNPATIEVEINSIKYQLTTMQSKIINTSNHISDLSARSEMYDKDINTIDTYLIEMQQRKDESENKIKDYEEWLVLERAFKEIPVLELESVSIVLTDYVNDLLSNVFNYSLSVKVITLMKKADGNSDKDVFKIVVYRNGEEVLPENLSGGQKQMVDSAIRMGIELTIKSVSEYEYKTSVFDEADSAVDADRSIDFFNMVNRVHKDNKKHFTFIITHTTEVQNQLDQIINVEEFKKHKR